MYLEGGTMLTTVISTSCYVVSEKYSAKSLAGILWILCRTTWLTISWLASEQGKILFQWVLGVNNRTINSKIDTWKLRPPASHSNGAEADFLYSQSLCPKHLLWFPVTVNATESLRSGCLSREDTMYWLLYTSPWFLIGICVLLQEPNTAIMVWIQQHTVVEPREQGKVEICGASSDRAKNRDVASLLSGPFEMNFASR